MIFLEILLFTSKLILILSESNQNHNFKDFFVCNCVCVLTHVHFQVLVWLRRALIFAVMGIGSCDSYFILSILTSWILILT